MKDNHSAHTVRSAMTTTAAATSTVTGTSIDRRGFDSLTFIAQVGAGGITFTGTDKLELVMEHSDNGSTWTAVATADVLGAEGGVVTSGVVKAWTAAKAAASVDKFGYIGGKRYARLSPTFGGTHSTGTAVAGVALLGHPEISPAVS